MYQQASQLTRVEIVNPGSVIGRNSIKAVQAGVYYGYVGAVDEIVTRMKALMKKQPTVVATGGVAELICAETRTIDVVDPLLTLKGLKRIYERNQS